MRTIPKHRLGAEFVMDYALERFSGEFDLVEIESSNLKLFTKDGNPTSDLVHAEQQVLDWLEWIEKNNSYARYNLPGVMSPQGFVVIGRKPDLSKESAEKLKKRNSVFRGSMTILTYDDVLARANALLGHLKGLNRNP